VALGRRVPVRVPGVEQVGGLGAAPVVRQQPGGQAGIEEGEAPPRQVFQREWLRTGDTYVKDAEGYYTCLGRAADMLKPGGIWVRDLAAAALAAGGGRTGAVPSANRP
jgi:acyl-CoA synthetase (AMP-forming)/AMP-acid ligase II